MSFTYTQIATSARQALRDSSAVKWSNADLLEIMNDGVAVITRVLEMLNPEIVWTEGSIVLTAGNYGPYELPAGFKRALRIEDDYNNHLKVGTRNDYVAGNTEGRPDEYTIEGYNPAKIYFNAKPPTGSTYTYKLFYLANLTRATDIASAVALPDWTYEALKEWTIKMAGIMDEYQTIDEDQKLAIIMPYLKQDALGRANEIQFEVEGWDTN